MICLDYFKIGSSFCHRKRAAYATFPFWTPSRIGEPAWTRAVHIPSDDQQQGGKWGLFVDGVLIPLLRPSLCGNFPPCRLRRREYGPPPSRRLPVFPPNMMLKLESSDRIDPVQKGFGGKSGASGPLVMVSSHFILNCGGMFFP